MSTINLNFDPRPWQYECLLKFKRFNVLVIHRRAGKTVLACMKLIDSALRTIVEDAQFGYLAPFRNQAKKIAWKILKAKCKKIPDVHINEQDLVITFPNGAQISLYGADNPDTIRGTYLDGIVMDEYSDVKSNVFGEIILPMLTDHKGWALFIGTPKGINRFSDIYFSASNKDDWYSALYDVYQTDTIDAVEIEVLKSEMTENQFKQEMLCDFQANNSDSLFSILGLMESRNREYHPHHYSFAPTIVGCDVARMGDDASAFCTRQGLFSSPIETHRDLDSIQGASKLALYCDRVGAEAVHIDGTGGYGAGWIDAFRAMRRRCRDVQFASKANDPKFYNKRTEMYWDLAEWVNSGGKIPDDSELIAELVSHTISYKGDRLLLCSKDDVKERIGRSPDKADALALTFAYPVSVQRAMHRKPTQAQTD